ncbi:hypothetical protein ASD76_08810 [Altererythrobacter sp. Root672]|nr:hypothetical protein ASD76_08810 [Altererythrobacter sp. Root672]
MVLVAVSKSYFDLVAEDLTAIEKAAPGRLRLFGRTLGRHLPNELARTLMPYDERLDQVGIAGTLIDFAARALDDFVTKIDQMVDRDVQSRLVSARLAAVPPATKRPPQRRIDDQTVRRAIRSFLADGGRGGAKALAWLRHERKLSCEQGRFAKLFREELGETAR